MNLNAAVFTDLQYLETVLNRRLEHHFDKKSESALSLPPPPVIKKAETPYANFVQQHNLLPEQRITLLLALAPHVHPNFLEPLIARFMPKGGDFPEFGGVKEGNHRGILPTGETALFVLAGEGLPQRMQLQQQLFSAEQLFGKEKILYVEEVKPGNPAMSGKLILDPDYVEVFTVGRASLPHMSARFPAQHITTELEWEDIVLNDRTLAQIQDLEAWIKHNDTLMYSWDMYKKLKPGYRTLFYGPPGTGKTFTATLLGKYTGKEVFKIDLSMVISKYIGETEKNLANLFDKAQNKDWILFFDEADAIFGRRTNIRDAHDKYANQEVSYLLQRVEDYPGLTILASNFRSNIDEAFLRRFNAVVHFPMPNYQERYRIWARGFPPKMKFAPEVGLREFARQYELSGSNIMNIVQYCCLTALNRGIGYLDNDAIQRGVTRELEKEGRMS